MKMDHNSLETGRHLDAVLTKLSTWQADLRNSNAVDAAEQISLGNQLNSAIQLLKGGESYEPASRALSESLPIVNSVYQQETHVLEGETEPRWIKVVPPFPSVIN